MSDQTNSNDPLQFIRTMWGNMGFSLPGMVAPTFDVDELEKRITDLKAVEGWLRMNLSMLQMTIQGLEMQKTTLTAVQTMGQMASSAAQSAVGETGNTPGGQEAGGFSQAAMWPWQMMQEMQEKLQQATATHAEGASQPAKTAASKEKKAKS